MGSYLVSIPNLGRALRLAVHAGVLAAVGALAPVAARASGTITNCTEAALRAALEGGGSVRIQCGSIIPLANTVVVDKPVVLDGTGFSPGLSGSAGTNQGPMFLVQRGASLILRSITVSNGRIVGTNGVNGQVGQSAIGAAILNQGGSVILDGCTFSSHSVTAGNGSSGIGSGKGATGGRGVGGAVYNQGGELIVTNCVFIGNAAVGGTGGNGSTPSAGGNGSNGTQGGDGGTGDGAAIYNAAQGVVTIYESLFSSNNVSSGIAGVGGLGSGALGFPGPNGSAGAAHGAAVFNESGTLAILNSSFANNTALGAAGAAGAAGESNIDGTPGSPGGAALGGGVYAAGGTAALTNCTFVGNVLTGGTGGTGGSGRTFGFGSAGASGGSGGPALGGGVCSGPGATTLIVNCTFSDNQVKGGAGGAGGVGAGLGGTGSNGNPGSGSGGAVYGQGGTLLLKNSILAYSLLGPNGGGTIMDSGFNLSSDATPTFTAGGSRDNVDPLLGSFATIGSSVPTMSLSSNSPAINAITAFDGNGAPPFDQRDASRTMPYDIGAFELGGTLTPPNLQAQVLANQVLLSWAASGASFTLQTTTNLANASGWTTVTNAPTTSASLQNVSVLTTNRAAFYRLASP